MRNGFVIVADLYAILAFTINRFSLSDISDIATIISSSLAGICSLIVIVPWVVARIKNYGKTRRKKMSRVRKTKGTLF